MATQNRINRTYGKEQTMDIMYNTQTKQVFFSLNFGAMGRKTFNLVKNTDGTFDIQGNYFKDGQSATYKMGKTFPATDRNNQPVEGITSGSIGLRTTYDKTLKRDITTNEDGFFFSTHKLQQIKTITPTMAKIGWITGKFGTEIEEVPEAPKETPTPTEETPTEEIPNQVVVEETPTTENTVDTSSTQDEDEIPF